MQKKTVLVTGAGGYIGPHAVSALLDLGADVIAVDYKLDTVDDRARKIYCDIFSDEPGLFDRLGHPDACLHMAWKDGFRHNSDAHISFLSDHYKFIRRMTDEGLKQIAVMGTMHEIGYWEGSVEENTACNPQSLYGIAKNALRQAAFAALKDKDVILQWLRAYYIYGDDERSVSIFGKLAAAEKRGDREFPFTTGKNKYDFIPVEELGRQLAACVMQTEVRGVINCCTGQPLSIAEKVESYIAEKGYRIRLKYGAYPNRPYDSPGMWGNTDKIRQIMQNVRK